MIFGMPTLIEFASIKENLSLCARLGLDFIELNMNLPQFQPQILMEDADAYRQFMKDTGIYYTLHLDENLNFADFNPLVRQAYLQTTADAIRIAKELRMPVINLHMPQGVHFTLPDKKVYLLERYASFFERAVAEFRMLCEREIGNEAVKICIENTDGYKDYQIKAIEILLESPCFALTWDIGHSHTAKNADEPFLLQNKDRLAHFHIHDAAEKKNHLALGTGEIDLDAKLSIAEETHCRCVIETKTAAALTQSVRYLSSRR